MKMPSVAVAGIAVAELLCTSLWFSVNGAGAEALSAWGLGATGVAWLTNAAQAGFIAGTLLVSLSLGMKLVVSWSRGGSSMTLALLVGILAVGTAAPHLIRASAPEGSWQWTVAAASVLALTGGLLVMWIGDGPFAPARRIVPGSGQVLRAFRSSAYRAAALG
jgi:hypothetical protein